MEAVSLLKARSKTGNKQNLVIPKNKERKARPRSSIASLVPHSVG